MSFLDDDGNGPRVSVVLPARNAERTISSQLRALAAQSTSFDWEVIVVDDGGSDDRTRDIVTARAPSFPSLRVIDGPRAGAGAARNAGAAQAKGALLCFCDADDIVDADWLQSLVAGLERADAVGGRNSTRLLGIRSGEGAVLPARSDGLLFWAGFLPYAISANFGVRREVFDSLGGFAQASAAEDVDLCWRIQESGRTLIGVPGAVVHYRPRETTRALMRQRLAYGRRKPWLYSRHRDAGMPASGLLHGLKRWAMLMIGFPHAIRSGGARRAWVGEFAFRAGALLGSIEHRTVHL